MERRLSPRSATSPTEEAAACRLSRPAPRLDDVDDDDDDDDDEEEEDAPHDEQWSVPTYLRRERGSMPRPSSWTVIIDDDDDCMEAALLPAVPAPPPPPPTTTVTVAADADAAFRTSSSTARPTLPMTVPARTAPLAAAERGRRRPPPPLLVVLLGLLAVLMMVGHGSRDCDDPSRESESVACLTGESGRRASKAKSQRRNAPQHPPPWPRC